MADLTIVIKGDSASVQKALKNTNASLKKTEKQTKKTAKAANPGMKVAFAAVAAVLTGVVAQGFKKVIGLASDLEEANAKFGTVFRGNSREANRMRQELVDSYGLSAAAATEFLGTVQDFLVPMGFARKEATSMSGDLVILARDLASFNQGMGITTDQALKDLTGAISGIKIPMKKYGVDINDAALANFALAQGITTATKDMTTQEKASLILQKTIADTSDAQGDYIRTQDSLANSMKTITAAGQDMATVIGQDINAVIQPSIVNFKKWIKSTEGLTAANKAIKGMWFYMTVVKEAIGSIIRPFIFFGKIAWTAIWPLLGLWLKLAKKLVSFAKSLGAVKDIVIGFAKSIKETLTSNIIKVFNKVVDGAKAGVQKIAKLISLIPGLGDKFSKIAEVAGNVINNTVNPALSSIGTTIKDVVNPALNTVSETAKIGFGLISSYWEENKGILTGGFADVQEAWKAMMDANGAATIDGMDKIVLDNEDAAARIKATWEKQQKELKAKNLKMWSDRAEAAQKYVDITKSIASGLIDIEKNKLATMGDEDEKAKRKQAKRIKSLMKFEKAANIASAIIDTAAAVAKTLPNIPLSIAVGVAGAIQVAKIASTPIPSIADISAPHGADFTTDGQQTLTVGDNPSGRERVTVTPEEDDIQGGGNIYYIDNITVVANNPEEFGEQMKEFGIVTARRA